MGDGVPRAASGGEGSQALLLSLGIEFHRTHDLATLLSQLPTEMAEQMPTDVAGLTVFSIAVRYPTGSWDPLAVDDLVDHGEAQAAVEAARRFLAIVQDVIDSAGRSAS